MVLKKLAKKGGYVPLSWVGKPMGSGAISRQIHTLWCKAGIFSEGNNPKKLSCNITRKSASTGVHKAQPGMKGDVAGLMTHSETTADKHYISDKMQKASTAGDALRTFFNPDEQFHNSPSRHKWSKDAVNIVSVDLELQWKV